MSTFIDILKVQLTDDSLTLAVIHSPKIMEPDSIVFEELGHPTIRLQTNGFSVKAVDYSIFRDFEFIKIKSIKFYRPYEDSFVGYMYGALAFWSKFLDKDDYVLRIKLKDGEHWDYQTTYKYSPKFKSLIESLQSKLNVQKINH